ncbi:MAG: twin-arginine translocase TatA/TatE family subunit [Candidatus Sulfotelmatobacter sp.]
MSLSEMLFLGLLGLVIFGPKKLAEVAQGAGKLVARWKNVSREFQSQLATEISATANDLKMERVRAEAGLVETSLAQTVTDR